MFHTFFRRMLFDRREWTYDQWFRILFVFRMLDVVIATIMILFLISLIRMVFGTIDSIFVGLFFIGYLLLYLLMKFLNKRNRLYLEKKMEEARIREGREKDS